VLLEEVARLVADISGKPVQRIGVTGDQLLEGLKAAGVPGFMAQLLVAFDLDAAAGHHEIVTDTVERFTGRQPESLAAFLRANADRLRT
jgi:NAD(P)H dehydrogenase (quinone)